VFALYPDAVPDDGDVEASGLLDGLEGRARRERQELILWLLDHGFNLDQIRGASIPLLLPANRVVGDNETLVSLREVSASGGVNLDLLQRLHRAAGLPRVSDADVAALSRADAEAVLRAAELVNLGIEPERVILIVRLLMEGLSRAAVPMRQAAMQALLRPGATEVELAQAFEAFVREAEPLMGPLIGDLLWLALRHSFETEAISAAERATGTLLGARNIAVAFADLVGFTRLGEALTPEELGLVATRLADLARDVVGDPVQFVKTIGDEVMLVSPDPVKLLTAVLDLIDAAAADSFPKLRVGIAFGPAVSHAGDWYGNPVNLASRVTGIPPPGAVLATESARNAIGDPAGIEWSFTGARQIRGIRGEVRLFRARRTPVDQSV
jgi:adenylate cyclase